MTKKKNGPLSLHPLPITKAVGALLSTPPPRKQKDTRKKPNKK